MSPVKDEVVLNFSKKVCAFQNSLLETGYFKEVTVKNIKQITLECNGKPVDAFLAEIGGTYSRRQKVLSYYREKEANCLAVFLNKDELLGDIKCLDVEEWKDYPKSSVRKYLRLRFLNASYCDNYKGVGSALIKEAVEKSKQLGLGGQLKVCAYNAINS